MAVRMAKSSASIANWQLFSRAKYLRVRSRNGRRDRDVCIDLRFTGLVTVITFIVEGLIYRDAPASGYESLRSRDDPVTRRPSRECHFAGRAAAS
jgi:hypothetical protein